MRPCCSSMSSSNRKLSGSLPVFIELREMIPAVLLNVFSKTLSRYNEKVLWGRMPFGLYIYIHRTPGKDYCSNSKSVFWNLGRYDGETYCMVEHL